MTEPTISAASFAYPHVSGDVRSSLANALLTADTTGVFVLSTCLRIEVAVRGGTDELAASLSRVFGDLPAAHRGVVRTGNDAVEHLYRVAAGLESPVVGEPEILTQFRAALNATKEGLDGLFQKIFEQAIPVGRSARELLPFNPHESMAAVAAQVVGHADRVAVLGSGVMATAVAEALKLLPSPPEITVAARHPERVSLTEVKVVGFGEARSLLADFPAVVSATSAKTRLVPAPELAEIISARTHPLALVDMAMPPDFEVPAEANVSYTDIDGLARRAARQVQSEPADRFIAQAANEAYQRVATHHEVGPVIEHLMKQADVLVDQTVDRFSGRLSDPGDEDVLRQAAHTVARALLADPVSYVKRSRQSEVDVVAEAFGFDA